jgi:hypothetical protein
MSIYSVHKVCWLVHHDPEFRERFRKDPAGAVAGWRFTEAERTGLLAGDVGTLALMGAHGYLLGLLQRHRVLGLDRQVYLERMRPAKLQMQGASARQQ